MKKRIIGLLLCLAMAFALLPVTAAAAETRKVGTMEEFKAALERTGDTEIVVEKDLILSGRLTTLGSVYIDVGAGNKTVDLAGHTVEVNATGGGRFTMIRVRDGAELTVRDTSAGKNGKLWADGDMVFQREGFTLPYYHNEDVRYRDVIHVDGGKFTLESGTVEAGRAKSVYIYYGMKVNMFDQQLNNALSGGVLYWACAVRYDGNAYQIVNGNAVLMTDGSVTINGGTLLGKGYHTSEIEFNTQYYDVRLNYGRAAALRAAKGDVTINGGRIYGMANANALSVSKDNVKVTVKAGVFETQRLSNVVLPSLDSAPNAFRIQQFVACYSELEDARGDRTYGKGAGSLGLPPELLDNSYEVTLDGTRIYKEDWTWDKVDYTEGGSGHTLTVAPMSGVTSVSMKTSALEAAQNVTSVSILGTMAKDMTLTQDTLVCKDAGVAGVTTTWYRDNELITGSHQVRFGNYLAKVVVTAKTGYRFTDGTAFTITGDKPTLVQIEDNGRQAVVWSPLYTFRCDHAYNTDTTFQHDGLTHYRLCSVCGEKIGEEKHAFDGGRENGNLTTYTCGTCGYSYEKENGKTKIDFLVADLPVAVAGNKIPTPALKAEYAQSAKVGSWEITGPNGAAAKPGDAYEQGSYTFVFHIRAADGAFFAPRTVVNTLTGTGAKTEITDTELTATFQIYANPNKSAEVSLPAMTQGMTMGEYMKSVSATVGGKESGNIQATIKTHGKDDEVYVRKTSSGGWTLVRGADNLDAFFAAKIAPETRYDVSFDFSTDGGYVADDAIRCLSPASYEGYQIRGGETWFTVDAVVTSGSNKVSDVAVVSVTPPETGAKPEQDFDVINHTELDLVIGGWTTTEPFEAETAYTYTAKVKVRDGYVFDSKVTASVNGAPAAVTVSGDVATVTYTFPKTEASKAELGAAKANPFTDVKESDPFYDAVLWAYYHEPQITNGTAVDKFSPAMICTRGQVVTFLWRAYGCPEPKMSMNPFRDVAADIWYYKPVLWAVEQGITNGTGVDTFSPEMTCSYAHVLTFLYRAAGSPDAKNDPNRQWYHDALTWAQGKGLLTGTGLSSQMPADACPRQDIVMYIYRQLK